MSAAQQLTSHAESTVGRARANAYLKRLRLITELRLVSTHGPAGVYVLPAFESEHVWHGAMFVRHGPYRGAVLRLVLRFASTFPRAPPQVAFVEPIPFHPMVNASTGIVSFAADSKLAAWSHETCFVFELLACLKRMFTVVDSDVLHAHASNHEAVTLLQRDSAAFLAQVKESVERSNAAVDSSLETDEDEDGEERFPFTAFEQKHADFWALLTSPPTHRQHQQQQQQLRAEPATSISRFFHAALGKFSDPQTGQAPLS
jgi:ubiquitin-protein ligase